MAKAHGVSNERMEQEYVHIISGMSDAGSLKVAFSALGKRETSQVLAFNELFSIGPLSGLDTLTGMQNRHQWVAERDENYSISQHCHQENQLVRMSQTVKSIPPHKIIVIWVADNAHDQTGLRFVLHLLRDRIQPVHMVDVTELYHSAGIHCKEGVTPHFIGGTDREDYLLIVKNIVKASRLHLIREGDTNRIGSGLRRKIKCCVYGKMPPLLAVMKALWMR